MTADKQPRSTQLLLKKPAVAWAWNPEGPEDLIRDQTLGLRFDVPLLLQIQSRGAKPVLLLTKNTLLRASVQAGDLVRLSESISGRCFAQPIACE